MTATLQQFFIKEPLTMTVPTSSISVVMRVEAIADYCSNNTIGKIASVLTRRWSNCNSFSWLHNSANWLVCNDSQSFIAEQYKPYLVSFALSLSWGHRFVMKLYKCITQIPSYLILIIIIRVSVYQLNFYCINIS